MARKRREERGEADSSATMTTVPQTGGSNVDPFADKRTYDEAAVKRANRWRSSIMTWGSFLALGIFVALSLWTGLW